MIDHNILFSKLSHYGIKDMALKLIKHYFTGRKQYCTYKGTNSSMLNIHKGVPQGSILGPLFFSLYINDFVHSTDKYNFLMYADNTTLISTYETFSTDVSDIHTIERNINTEQLLILTWLSRNKLLINITKTKMTIFHTQKRNVSYPTIFMNTSPVEIVDDFKFSGNVINKHLKWTTNIEYIAVKFPNILEY